MSKRPLLTRFFPLYIGLEPQGIVIDPVTPSEIVEWLRQSSKPIMTDFAHEWLRLRNLQIT